MVILAFSYNKKTQLTIAKLSLATLKEDKSPLLAQIFK